jgi:hypothetical protein
VEEGVLMARYQVVGIDDEGDETELRETDYFPEAEPLFRDYVSKEDAGGWNLVQLVDTEAGPQSSYYVIREWEREIPYEDLTLEEQELVDQYGFLPDGSP